MAACDINAWCGASEAWPEARPHEGVCAFAAWAAVRRGEATGATAWRQVRWCASVGPVSPVLVASVGERPRGVRWARRWRHESAADGRSSVRACELGRSAPYGVRGRRRALCRRRASRQGGFGSRECAHVARRAGRGERAAPRRAYACCGTRRSPRVRGSGWCIDGCCLSMLGDPFLSCRSVLLIGLGGPDRHEVLWDQMIWQGTHAEYASCGRAESALPLVARRRTPSRRRVCCRTADGGRTEEALERTCWLESDG